MEEMQLVETTGTEPGRVLEIDQPVTIGRDPDGDVFIDDSEVSRRHVAISAHAGRVTLQDLESTNGTFVNGKRISGVRTIGAGDSVRIGTTELEVRAVAAGTRISAIPNFADGKPDRQQVDADKRAQSVEYPTAVVPSRKHEVLPAPILKRADPPFHPAAREPDRPSAERPAPPLSDSPAVSNWEPPPPPLPQQPPPPRPPPAGPAPQPPYAQQWQQPMAVAVPYHPQDHPVHQAAVVMANHKSAGLAILLSFFLPGLGQIYANEGGKGVLLLMLYLGNLFVGFLLLIIVVGIFFLFAACFIWGYAMVDANNCAKRYNARLLQTGQPGL